MTRTRRRCAVLEPDALPNWRRPLAARSIAFCLAYRCRSASSPSQDDDEEEEEEAKPAAKKAKAAPASGVDVSAVNGSRTIFMKNLAWAADEVRAAAEAAATAVVCVWRHGASQFQSHTPHCFSLTAACALLLPSCPLPPAPTPPHLTHTHARTRRPPPSCGWPGTRAAGCPPPPSSATAPRARP